jgi:DNA-binding PadR family transcriptional regulator
MGMVISTPRGLLKLVSLQLLSESSLSGAELQAEIRRASDGAWRPGPGSIYFILEALRKDELVVELPRRGGGTVRRYVISNKGKGELTRLRGLVDEEVRRQLRLLAYCCDHSSNPVMAASLRKLAGAPGADDRDGDDEEDEEERKKEDEKKNTGERGDHSPG